MKVKAKHTPGPWEVNTPVSIRMGGSSLLLLEYKGRPVPMGGRLLLLGVPTLGERRANAQLIAAAPDLLAALEIAWRWQNSDLADEDEILNIMALAIAKAKGKEA